MPSPGPGGSQSSLAGMVVSWLTSQFRTGRSSRKLAMRLDGKREPDYHVERADAAAAWRRHFQTAAFLLERGREEGGSCCRANRDRFGAAGERVSAANGPNPRCSATSPVGR